jgi:hypothetical protein
MLAQRYPTAYDGIAACAPAIYWTEFFPSVQWPQQFMNMLGKYPYSCEVDAITAAAILACDQLDGVVDGIIGEVDACLSLFNPFELVDTTIFCNETGSPMQISNAAAKVVNATWHGPRKANGKQWWYGLYPGTNLVSDPSRTGTGSEGVAQTNCSNGTCVGLPNVLGQAWLRMFVLKDPAFDFSHLSHTEFDSLVHLSTQIYSSIISTSDPDLTEFHASGGKLITAHGLVSGKYTSNPIEGEWISLSIT